MQEARILANLVEPHGGAGLKPLLLPLAERAGVGAPLLALADEVAELPVRGITNSLNVAMCAGAVLYEVLERARSRGDVV